MQENDRRRSQINFPARRRIHQDSPPRSLKKNKLCYGHRCFSGGGLDCSAVLRDPLDFENRSQQTTDAVVS